MINAYTRNAALAVDGIVPFESVTLDKGCSASISGSTIQLKKAGLYIIHFYAVAVPGAAGTVAFQMLTNGIAKGGDLTTVNGATTTTEVVVPIITTVQVPHDACKCSCANSPVNIQFQNTGVATITDANVVVTKVC